MDCVHWDDLNFSFFHLMSNPQVEAILQQQMFAPLLKHPASSLGNGSKSICYVKLSRWCKNKKIINIIAWFWIEKPSTNFYSDPRLWNWAHHFGTYFLEFSAAQHLVLCATPLHHFVHAQIPQPFYQNLLVPILLLPFIANPPSKKHRRENERQK